VKNSPILNYKSWLVESARVLEAVSSDPMTLFNNKDASGLVAYAAANDSADVKAHEAYASVMDWWNRGKGKGGPLLKAGGERKGDREQSLKSLYYWAGASTGGDIPKSINQFFAVADAIVANPNLGTSQDFKDAIASLKKEQQLGFVLRQFSDLQTIISTTLINDVNSPAKIKAIAANSTDLLLPTIKQSFNGNSLATVNNLIAKKSDAKTWTSSLKLDDSTKLALLTSFKDKAKAHADTKGIDLNEAIDQASDLYIAPKSEKLQVSTTPAGEPTNFTVTYSYPPDAEGNAESEEFKQGLQLFPDDGATIKEDAKAALNESVKKAVDAVKTANGEITGVRTWGFSGTSKVPTAYKSADEKYSTENNVTLADDRLSAINTALAEALTENGIIVTPTVSGNTAEPNRGPEWGDDQRKDTEKYGTSKSRTATYEAEYGPYRYARAFFEITYKSTGRNSVVPQELVTPVGSWNALINWGGEAFKIKLPSISGKGGSGVGKVTNYHGSCPRFN